MGARFDGQRATESITQFLDRITEPVQDEGDILTLATFVSALVLKYQPVWQAGADAMPSAGMESDQSFVLRETFAALAAASRRVETAYAVSSRQQVVS
jgi:hypothetical protein